MATAKKKSSSKKAASKKKNVAAKSTTKKTVTTPPKTNDVSTGKVSRFELLRRFHIFSAVVGVVIAIAAVFFLNSQTVNFTINYSAKDPIASVDNTVLGPATESIVTIEFKYLVAAFFIVAAILSLLLATVLRKKYEAGISNATSGLRWVATGISTALLLELVAIQCGVEDVVTLKLIAGLVVATTVLGWMAERDNKNVSTPKWSAYGLSVFTGVLTWLPIAVALVGTYVYGIERFSWFVYVIVILAIYSVARVGRTLYRYIKYPKIRGEYIGVEEKYLSSDLFLKLSFAAVIFIALFD